MGTILEGMENGQRRRERERLEYIGEIIENVECKKHWAMKRFVFEQTRIENCIKPVSELMTQKKYDALLTLSQPEYPHMDTMVYHVYSDVDILVYA